MSAQGKSIWPWLRSSNSQNSLQQAAEAEARQRSDMIDMELAAERARLQQESKTKILLLGPSEAGKTTVVKNFQLAFTPKSFLAQAAAWLPVIQLNLVHSVNTILDALDLVRSDSAEPEDSEYQSSHTIPEDLRQLGGRIAEKLAELESELSGELYSSAPPPSSRPPSRSDHERPRLQHRLSMVSVRGVTLRHKPTEFQSAFPSWKIVVDRARAILAECAPDIASLWAHPWVRSGLKAQGIHPEHQPGYFLPDAARIASPHYLPTPEDILRARLTTASAEEHSLMLDVGMARKEWLLCDVGGSRSQRGAWAQYFDDAKLVIFVASLTAFDETLAEDSAVNRLTDTLLLWRNICANKLLASVELVLFLNKLDILKAKLENAGVAFVHHVNSFKSRPNDVPTVSKYIKEMFLAQYRQYSSSERKVFAHITCAVVSRFSDRLHLFPDRFV
ncbi:hypothetical protein HGRIS_000425 [Hohenbuehelia grisea]|uniref:G-alpha-domain-containing protein n=1 Tax=Hohenbuehelia grisea TaxID=104357 RepID=A0ABR3JR59_9AGAR